MARWLSTWLVPIIVIWLTVISLSVGIKSWLSPPLPDAPVAIWLPSVTMDLCWNSDSLLVSFKNWFSSPLPAPVSIYGWVAEHWADYSFFKVLLSVMVKIEWHGGIKCGVCLQRKYAIFCSQREIQIFATKSAVFYHFATKGSQGPWFTHKALAS